MAGAHTDADAHMDTATAREEAARAQATIIEEYLYGRRHEIALPRKTQPEFGRQVTDTIITTFPKSGTTLLQQLAYQIVVHTGGAPQDDPDGLSFADISERVPWLHFAPPRVVANACANPSNPRLFKTHATVASFDVDAQRHIVVLRHPHSVMRSLLDFHWQLFAHALLRGADTRTRELVFQDTVARALLGTGRASGGPLMAEQDAPPMGTWVQHTHGWLQHAAKPNVLVLFYEDVTRDIEATARRVAQFLGCQLSEDGVRAVAARCSRQYMAADDRFKSLCDAEVLNIEARGSKVNMPGSGGFAQCSLNEDEDRALTGLMQTHFGVDNYEQLKQKFG